MKNSYAAELERFRRITIFLKKPLLTKIHSGVMLFFGEAGKRWEKGQITFDEALRRTQMKEAAFYRRLREYRLLIITGKKLTINMCTF